MYQFVCVFLIVMLIAPFSKLSYSNDYSRPDKVIIPLNNWSSQRVLSHVVGKLIQRLGVEVKYQNIAATDQWGALRKGIVHLQIEVWQQSMSKEFNDMINNNYIIDLGTHSAVAREEWWYPEYVEKDCPELPQWTGLKKCALLFSSRTMMNKGVFYTGPWDYNDADLIRALNLNFSIKRLSSAKALWQKLRSAIADQRPIMILNWTPNWTSVRIKGQFVEFPQYTPECESVPSWGINKNIAKDCGNIKEGWLKKAAWTGLKETWPCVYSLMENIDLNNAMISDASALVVIDGYSEEEAANIWIDKYSQTIIPWLDIQCHK
ncbi:ABC transporter substrate-binding protein [Pseudoalteromonas sp. MMG005]|jgi:glycine betaine/proline transport system substrate-binding protein|uniref:ABC transporter substrate-binding protein n=1 Tax=Pseudoalteromonas sp. MMG005 TaxID=2822682 RepID=UPI001FFD987B|nr:ABC transporter substrate-binding protein [Pseudoalteromonas sp. MMG005]